MRLAKVEFDGHVRPALVDGDQLQLVETDSVASALSLIAAERDLPVASEAPLSSARLLAPVDDSSKFFCIGLNYYSHMEEASLPKPAHPIIFTKYPSVLIGPEDDILLPNTSTKIDWETELCVVIGKRLREATVEQAEEAIGGFTIANDVSARDYQLHESQWTPGKNVEASTPVGPWIVTVDELGPNPDLSLVTRVSGTVRQDGRTADMIFTPAQCAAYISEFITLEPGDIIATGTCAGVGHCMTPPVYMGNDDVLESTIEKIGTLTNRCLSGRVSAGAVALV